MTTTYYVVYRGDGQEVVRLLDDSILVDADEFSRDCEQLARAGVKTIWDALDIRLVNDQTAEALASIGHAKRIHSQGNRNPSEARAEALALHLLRARRLQHVARVRHAQNHDASQVGREPVGATTRSFSRAPRSTSTNRG